MFALPLYVEMPYVLKIWLKNVPEYAVDFCRVFLLIALVGQLSSGLMTAIQAKGKIAAYQVAMSLLLLLNLPVAYFLQGNGVSPTVVLWSMLTIEIVCLVARLVFAKRLVGLAVNEYVRAVLLKLIIVFIPSTLIVICSKNFVSTGWSEFMQLCLSVVLTISLVAITSYMSFDKDEKKLVQSFINKFFNKIRK
jgi:nitrogen fixation/metabolism regulation signal transduction histidine kinase